MCLPPTTMPCIGYAIAVCNGLTSSRYCDVQPWKWPADWWIEAHHPPSLTDRQENPTAAILHKPQLQRCWTGSNCVNRPASAGDTAALALSWPAIQLEGPVTQAPT